MAREEQGGMGKADLVRKRQCKTKEGRSVQVKAEKRITGQGMGIGLNKAGNVRVRQVEQDITGYEERMED